MIVKFKLKGIATQKNEVLGRFRRGGLSSRIKYLDFLKINTAGIRKKLKHIKLKLYVPIKDKIWIKAKFCEKENAKRFQGKPVNTLPLINSEKPKRTEKIKTKLMLLKFLKSKEQLDFDRKCFA